MQQRLIGFLVKAVGLPARPVPLDCDPLSPDFFRDNSVGAILGSFGVKDTGGFNNKCASLIRDFDSALEQWLAPSDAIAAPSGKRIVDVTQKAEEVSKEEPHKAAEELRETLGGLVCDLEAAVERCTAALASSISLPPAAAAALQEHADLAGGVARRCAAAAAAADMAEAAFATHAAVPESTATAATAAAEAAKAARAALAAEVARVWPLLHSLATAAVQADAAAAAADAAARKIAAARDVADPAERAALVERARGLRESLAELRAAASREEEVGVDARRRADERRDEAARQAARLAEAVRFQALGARNAVAVALGDAVVADDEFASAAHALAARLDAAAAAAAPPADLAGAAAIVPVPVFDAADVTSYEPPPPPGVAWRKMEEARLSACDRVRLLALCGGDEMPLLRGLLVGVLAPRSRDRDKLLKNALMLQALPLEAALPPESLPAPGSPDRPTADPLRRHLVRLALAREVGAQLAEAAANVRDGAVGKLLADVSAAVLPAPPPPASASSSKSLLGCARAGEVGVVRLDTEKWRYHLRMASDAGDHFELV